VGAMFGPPVGAIVNSKMATVACRNQGRPGVRVGEKQKAYRRDGSPGVDDGGRLERNVAGRPKAGLDCENSHRLEHA
jgi:hypothetical protein